MEPIYLCCGRRTIQLFQQGGQGISTITPNETVSIPFLMYKVVTNIRVTPIQLLDHRVVPTVSGVGEVEGLHRQIHLGGFQQLMEFV
ncbi:hypothetical protein ACET69_03220 [Aeromonas veronii]